MQPTLVSNNVSDAALADKMLDLAARLATIPGPEALMNLLTLYLADVVPYDAVGIYAWDATRNLLVAQPTAGVKPHTIGLEGRYVRCREGLLGAVLKAGAAELINDAHLDNRRARRAGFNPRAEHHLVYLLGAAPTTWGVLVLTRFDTHRFSAEEFSRAARIATYAGLALVNLKLADTLREKEALQQQMTESAEGTKIFTGIIRDIAQRQKVVKKYKDSNMRLTRLIQTIQSAVLVEDENRKIVLCNDQFCSLFHRRETPDMLQGADGERTLAQGQDIFETPEAFTRLTQQLPGGKEPVTQQALKLADGRTVECDYVPIFVEKDYRGHMWLLRDITERKKAMRHMRKLARLTKENPNPIVRMNRQFELVDANDTAARFIEDVLQGQLPEEWRRMGEQSFETGQTINMEFYHKPSDRHYVAHIVPDKARKYINIYGRDITDLKHMQQDLTHAKQEAEKLARTKQTFLANMSHELRTPINGVLGLTNLLMRGALPEQVEYLGGIQTSGQQLLSVINDILDLSKIEAGMMRFEQTEFSPQQIITGLVGMFTVQAEQKGIALQVHSELKGTEVMRGDPVRLNQIMLNLVSNAVKFTRQGSITISARLVHEPVMALTFSVADTGIGIAPEKLDHIFERFVQAEDDVTRKYGGTGLGLTIVRQLVELLGGTLHVKSTLGTGSEFTLTIPSVFVRQQAEPAALEISPWDSQPSLEGFHVLIAEDNFINQVVARQTLEHWNIRTTVVNNGKEALEALGKNKFDLVLMDVQMPEMDGLTATKKIRESFDAPTCNIPIVAMTASVLDEPERRVMEGGMSDYIAKPFKPQDLYLKLARWLGKTVQTETMTAKHVHLDMAQLTSVFEDDKSLASFLASAEESLMLYLENLMQYRAGQDRRNYELELHRIKGSLGALGANACFNEAVNLERQIKMSGSADWPDHTRFLSMAESLLDEIRTERARY